MSRRKNRGGNNAIMSLNPETLSTLYMESVNRNPQLHPSITASRANTDTIASDFASWCSGFTVGCQQVQQSMREQRSNHQIFSTGSGSGSEYSNADLSASASNSGIGSGRVRSRNGLSSRSAPVFRTPGQRQISGNLPNTVKAALQNVIRNYGTAE